MKPQPSPSGRDRRSRILGVLLGSGLILIGLSYFHPVLRSGGNPGQSLKRMRAQSEAIKTIFSQILNEAERLRSRFNPPERLSDRPALYDRMREHCHDREKTGIALYSEGIRLQLWYGTVLDLEPLLELESRDFIRRSASFVVDAGSSVHLVSMLPLRNGEYLAFHRRLAFLPRFQAQYLKDSHFIPDRMLRNGRINYWDFRENLSGFERVFKKHKDEYIGQPRYQDQTQTLFFPLRTQDGRIAATITLDSPSLPLVSTARAEGLRLAGLLFMVLFLSAAAIRLSGEQNRVCSSTPSRLLLITACIVGIRALFLPIRGLSLLSSSDVFSPGSAGFLFPAGLAQSPADIFLTILAVFAAVGSAIRVLEGRIPPKRTHRPPFFAWRAAAWTAGSIGLLALFCLFLRALVRNCRIDLLKPELAPVYFLLHGSIFLAGLTLLLISAGGLRRLSPGLLTRITTRRIFPILLFTVLTLLVYITLRTGSDRKAQSLLETTLRDSIESQGDWGIFLLNQAIPEIEKRNDAVLSMLRASLPGDLAQELWRKTLLARMNWYSSLDIFAPDGRQLSRFSLNIPEPFRPTQDPEMSPEWTTLEQSVAYLGKTRDFIVAYRDLIIDGLHLGRVVLSVALDYKMLPFLYSPTPYFELTRISSLSSIRQSDFVFAVYDLQGRLVFDPDKTGSGVPAPLLENIHSGKTVRYRLHSRTGTSSGFFFRYKNNIFGLFRPLRGPLGIAVDFFKLLTVYLAALLAAALLAAVLRGGRIIRRNPLWSFSNRVYLSFVAVALIPLLLFTFSTQSFFTRVFTLKITDEAEVQAGFAQRMMEEFILLQQEDRVSLTIDPDRILLWISSTINNDVNLYLDGRLVSSSRREFFDAGLLPELIDGEIYFKFLYGNDPSQTLTVTIGEYAFHTLTLPYSFEEATLLISLPFPLEKEEISHYTADLLEFLFFLSCIFIAAVMLFARGMGGMIVNPIRKLLSGTREVSLGNLEVKVPHPHNDEMKTLIDGFNHMVTSMKKHRQEVADLSKKAAWAEMARKVAHEIKNPLTPIQLSAEHLQRVYAEKPEQFPAALEESTSYIVKEVENLRQIAQSFLETSKKAALKKIPTDVAELVRETLEPYRTTLSARITIRMSVTGENFQLDADRDQLKIVLRNLLTNAIESIRNKGEIEVRLFSENRELRIEIEDSGEGIDPEWMGRIFETDFSTKVGGTGLGLPIARKIVEDHGGDIRAFPGRIRGTRIEIHFPRNERSRPLPE